MYVHNFYSAEVLAKEPQIFQHQFWEQSIDYTVREHYLSSQLVDIFIISCFATLPLELLSLK
jgi:hypothetical protein